MKPIVVGVDGSTSSSAALRWALREGDLHDRPVVATMMWDYLNQHHPGGSQLFDPADDPQAERRTLDGFVLAALGADDAGRVEANLVFDLAARGLVEASADASLLVLGARGLGGFRELLLGSVGQRCLHEAHCTVAIVRASEDEGSAGSGQAGRSEHRRVVVGVDGSADGQAALHWAAVEASCRNAVLRVVHAAQPGVVGVPLPPSIRSTDVVHKEAAAVIEQAVARAELPSSVRLELVPATGSPARALIEACADADVVVVGRTGHRSLGGRVLGSVATQMSHHSAIPAVFVSSTDHR